MFKVFDFNKEDITNEAHAKGLSYVCSPLYQQLTVTVNKKIIVCSTIFAKNHGILGEYVSGAGSLMKVWNGEELQKMRTNHEKGNWDAIAACRSCDLPQIELLKKLKNIDGVMLR